MTLSEIGRQLGGVRVSALIKKRKPLAAKMKRGAKSRRQFDDSRKLCDETGTLLKY
jgi:hypothetical protein